MSITELTPRSLPMSPEAAVFRLRPAKEGEGDEFLAQARAAGLAWHDVDELREEAVRGLRELWHPAIVDASLVQLRERWHRLDAGEHLTDEESAGLAELGRGLLDRWPPFKLLVEENRNFHPRARKLALSRLLVGWRNVPLKFRRRRAVPLPLIEKLEAWLTETETGGDVIALKPGTAFRQLGAAAVAELLTPLPPGWPSAEDEEEA